MTVRTSGTRRPHPRVVGVITSCADMNSAIQLRHPPDLFELRLDHLVGVIDEVEEKILQLNSPLIITARHPLEGGTNKLSLLQRRNLLTRFLPYAKYVDVELRSAFAMHALLTLADQRKVRRIISFHNFKSTTTPRILSAKARAAKVHRASIFKLATRTDTPVQLARLLSFITNEKVDLPVSAMGIGKLGAISRLLLARAGSVLVYASIAGRTDIEGQLPLEQLRALGFAPLKR